VSRAGLRACLLVTVACVVLLWAPLGALAWWALG